MLNAGREAWDLPCDKDLDDDDVRNGRALSQLLPSFYFTLERHDLVTITARPAE